MNILHDAAITTYRLTLLASRQRLQPIPHRHPSSDACTCTGDTTLHAAVPSEVSGDDGGGESDIERQAVLCRRWSGSCLRAIAERRLVGEGRAIVALACVCWRPNPSGQYERRLPLSA
jgi:hypothetical protein